MKRGASSTNSIILSAYKEGNGQGNQNNKRIISCRLRVKEAEEVHNETK
jgi:hypothetical protein